MRAIATTTVVSALLATMPAFAADAPDPDTIIESPPELTLRAVDNFAKSPDGPLPAVDGTPRLFDAPTPAPSAAVRGVAPTDFALLPYFTRVDLDAVDDETGRLRTGLAFETRIALDERGDWLELEDGSHLWVMSVMTDTADWVRLQFAPYDPPIGVEVVLYNAGNPNEAYGPYGPGRGYDGAWWAPTVYGQEARVEIYVPADIEPQAVAERVGIAQAIQGFYPDESLDLACRLDVTCDSSWDNEARGVAHIQFVDGGSSYICSGSMLNRIGGDFAPMFLTAAHCINSEAEASSIEVYWLYQTDTCNGTPPGLGDVPRTDGSTLLAFWNTTDVSLLGLTGNIPGGLWWQGWDVNGIPNNEPGTLIHHPAGVRKSISYGVYEGRDDDQCALGDWTYRLDLSDGGQEGGSSGAPGFDSSSRVRTVASCSESGCSPGENTWEGSVPDTWSRLQPFLEASSSVWVNIAWGGTERGTQAEPWDELIEGYFGVLDGGTVHVVGGNYPAFTWEGPRSMTIAAEGGTVIIGN
jgi:hypothetical protein